MKKYTDLLPTTIKQFVKYGLIGLLNVIIYLAVFELLTRVFLVHYRISNASASLISFANSLYFNRRWTFKSQKHWLRDLLYFGIIFALCFTIQDKTLTTLVEDYKMDPQLAKYIAIFAFAIPNFTLNKLITFRTKKEELEQIENE
ncbi:MAG: GtrA family protein [Bacteroidetes bacterium]|nr:MAG: GtrA family protein [Bacteroidota bacterium]